MLSDVNLTVYQDDYLGIIGPNGGGKTTHAPHSGTDETYGITIRYFRKVKDENGKTVLDENGETKVEETKEISMGYLPQYNQLDKQFPISVYEVVLAGLSKTKGLFSRYTYKTAPAGARYPEANAADGIQRPTHRCPQRRSASASAPRPCHRIKARCRYSR